MDITKFLNEAANDIISDETKKLMQEAFEAEINTRVDQRLQLEMEDLDNRHATQLKSLVESIDNKHTEGLKKLVESIDTDHTKKMEHLVTLIESNYTKKLKSVKEHYEVNQKKEIETFKESILNAISEHIDSEIDSAIPADTFKSAANAYNSKNKKTVTESKKTPKPVTKEDSFLLESLTQNYPAEKRNYFISKLSGKTDKEVKDNFAYVEKMYARQSDKEKQVLAENAKRQSIQHDLSNEGNAEVSAKNDPNIDPFMNDIIQGFKTMF